MRASLKRCSVTSREPAGVVEQCWETVGTPAGTLLVETEGTVRADERHLRQLLVNLLRNAVEHGGDDVTITIGTLDGAAGFYVADDGPGLPAGDADQLFDPGYTSATEGTGIGLAIARTVARVHGWTLTAVERRTGARFEIADVELADR